jgi:DNA-binding IclR family transcriptional regulator
MRNLGISAETALSLHQAATSPLDRLRKVTDHTLHLAILDGTDVLYVERRESPQAMKVFSRVGGRNAAHVTSTGKVLLAHLPPEEQQRLVDAMRLTRKTPYSITSRTALLHELAQVRRQGFAENVFESAMGMVSIAAPVRGRTGRVVAALSVAGVADRDHPDGLRNLARPLIEAAGQVSHNLGWRRPGHGEPLR